MPNTNVSVGIPTLQAKQSKQAPKAVYTVRLSPSERKHLLSQSIKPTQYLRALIQHDMGVISHD